MDIAYASAASPALPEVTVARMRACDTCGTLLRLGDAAHLADGRGLRCVACVREGRAAAEGGAREAEVDRDALARTPLVRAESIPLPAAALIAATSFLARSRTVRRLAVTLGVAVKSGARLAWERLRGRRSRGPVVLRRAFEELGPTYVKLGQLVASTQGIFPEAYCEELRGCLDRVPPIPFDAIDGVIRGELARTNRKLADVFREIDRTPLAAASIAQVHAARLRDGSDVVVKVQRPGIDDAIAADMRIVRALARAAALTPRGQLANPVGIVDDFAQTLSEELDFTREAASMEEFNRIMREHDQDEVIAPRIVRDACTKRMIVMERFYGHRVDDVDAMRARGVDGEAKLLVGMRAWFQCVVFHGFFHGDVHAGNLMALTDGRIGFLDFGIVGRLGTDARRGVVDTLLCFAAGDFRKLADVWVAMGSVAAARPGDAPLDMNALARDLETAYEPLLGSTIDAVKYADLLPGILRTAERHRLRLPRDFVLITKQMLYFDRYARTLAPKLNVFRDPRVVTPLAVDVLAAGMRSRNCAEMADDRVNGCAVVGV